MSVPFYGDQVELIQNAETGEVWIPLKRVCENLGLDSSAQYRRFQGKRRPVWATVAVTAMVDPNGKIRETFCVDRRTFCSWLHGINTSRIKDPGTRAKVEAYQNEIADVIDRYVTQGHVGGVTKTDVVEIVGTMLKANNEQMAEIMAQRDERLMNVMGQMIRVQSEAFDAKIDGLTQRLA